MPHSAISYSDPLRAGRHPFQTYMLILCMIAGLPLLFGQPASATLEALLPPWCVYLWGFALTFGSAIALIGSYMPRHNYATVLTIERIGLAVTGFAGVAYSLLIGIYAGFQNSVAIAIIFGFGISCLIRARDIGKVIKRAIRTHYQDILDEPN